MNFWLKKTVALLVAAALVFGLALVVHSYSSYPGADKLKEYGFINGNENGDLLVDEYLGRAEACVLLAEMHGEKEKAKAFKGNGPDDFSDVGDKDWFAPYVRYANSRGWINGYTDGTFKPRDSVSVQMWAKMLLESLGYYQGWASAISDLSDLGVKIYAVDSLKIKRGEAFDVMWAAVNKNPKGETRSLGEIVGRLKPKQSDIRSVEMSTLAGLDILVSEALDEVSAEEVSNYLIVEESGAEVKILSVSYDAEAKKIGVTFENPVKPGAKLRLERANVKMEGEGMLEKSGFGEFVAQDNVPPKVISMYSLGTRALRIDFSEPVYSREGELVRGDFVFDKPVNVKNIKLIDKGRSAIIELNAAVKGALSVHPQKSIRDIFGHALITDKQSVNMAADTTALAIESVVSISPVEVVLKLSKGMSSARQEASMFRAGGRSSDGGAVIAGDILKIKFTKNYLSVGRATVTVAAGALTDYSGVTNKELNFDVTVPSDSEAPYSDAGVKMEKQNQLRIKFNEPLKATGTKLLLKSNYKLVYFGDSEVDKSSAIASVYYDSANFAVVINTAENLLGNYRLEILEALDLSGNNGASYFDFEARDVVSPNSQNWSAKLYNAGKANQMVRVKFDEPMMLSGKNGILEPENIMLGKISLDRLSGALLGLKANAAGDELEITYPNKSAGGMDFVASELGSMNLMIARVADAAGNLTESIANTVAITNPTGMRIEKAELVRADYVKLVVADEVFELDHTDIVVEAAGKRVYGNVSMEFENGSTNIYIEFGTALASPVTVRTVSGNSVSVYGEKFAVTSAMSVADKIGPAIEVLNSGENVYYDSAKRTIVLVFNEQIDARVVSLLSFEVPGISIDNITVNGREIHILVAFADKDKVQTEQLVLQKLEIRDLQGNGTADLVTSIRNIK